MLFLFSAGGAIFLVDELRVGFLAKKWLGEVTATRAFFQNVSVAFGLKINSGAVHGA